MPSDQVHARAERREPARILTPDHARADHRQCVRQTIQLQDCVRIVDALAAERKILRTHWRRSRDLFAAQQDALPAVSALYLNSMRVSERSEALIRDYLDQSSGFSERFMATISAWVMFEPRWR